MLNISLSRLHRYFLPAGFATIIILMIANNWVANNYLNDTNNKIIQSESQSNNINKNLAQMTDAKFQGSFLLLQMINSRHSAEREIYILKWEEQVKKYNSAKINYSLNQLSPKEENLLSHLEKVIETDKTTQDQIISLSRNYDTKKAAHVFNNELLPRRKLILDTIKELHKIENNRAYKEIEVTKKLSNRGYKQILSIDVISILIALALMLYLNKILRRSSRKLSLLAITDNLTQLPNRSGFLESIDQAIEFEKNECFATIFFDIDYFKSINDNYGHEIGDKVLKCFSEIITNSISSEDTLSRFGGDEFVLLLKSINNRNDAEAFVNKLSHSLDTSFLIDSNEIFLSSSIGISIYPDDANQAHELLKNADIAMYCAKQSGRNCYRFYSINNSQKLDEEHALSHSLQTILNNNNKDNELFMVYQPLVNIDSNNFNECEALIRWQDKQGNFIKTDDYIAISEKSNLIEKVNLFVIEEVCKQQKIWQEEGNTNIRININLSGNKRIFKELFKSLYKNIDYYNLRPELFGIELTERTIYEVSKETIIDLEHLRDLGMKIAIDDFGTGYSSLSYLKDLPITSVKIDNSFIKDLPNQKVDVALVKAIISLAHSLDYDVIAEGVENKEQFEFLKKCKCDIAQGYLLHRPLLPKDVSKLKIVA